MIHLTLVSNDQDTCTYLQDIARNNSSIRLSITGDPTNIIDVSGVYIWDYEPDLPIPVAINRTEPRKHVFLVRRKDLQAFRASVTQPGVAVLLKPVAWPVLEAFLENAAKLEAGAGALAGTEDELLQGLIQANLRLQEYDQDRTNFLARAVHDFRAPLTALSGYCSLLLGEHLGPLKPEQQDVLIRMERSARRLSRISSAMFQLSVGRVLKPELNLQPGDLRECMEQALHETLPLSDPKEIEVILDWVTPPSDLHFERSQMEQVLINLLENACKFTPRRGIITIRAYPTYWQRKSDVNSAAAASSVSGSVSQHNVFRIDILDSGPSIPVQYLQEIFEEYTTYSGGRDRAGGGLGLAICKSIVALHKGRIWAENSAEGVLFSLLLPLGEEQQKPPAREQNGREETALVVGA